MYTIRIKRDQKDCYPIKCSSKKAADICLQNFMYQRILFDDKKNKNTVPEKLIQSYKDEGNIINKKLKTSKHDYDCELEKTVS